MSHGQELNPQPSGLESDAPTTEPRLLMKKIKILLIIIRLRDWLCVVAVRHLLRDLEVRGSIPNRVKPKTLRLVLAADPPSVWHYGFSAKSGRPGVRILGMCVVMQALLTSQCGNTLSIVPSAVSDISSRLTGTLKISTTNQSASESVKIIVKKRC
ncbi:hypothetical protein ElyMa_005057400 [Elysia marginata]|uniref:Uncharacterized protein n=1 Tax=Elysia marginata TaxID=1093978 RepID=A0AAV4JFJ2_9GAST|nr:hypothetical protein ElyMa_005057400 [Elysia marginata]